MEYGALLFIYLMLLRHAHRNSRIRRSPAGVEGTAGAVEVDDQRCVIRGCRFSLPRLAIDFGPRQRGVFKGSVTSR